MRRVFLVIGLVCCGAALLAQTSTYDLAVQTRDCIASLPLKNNAPNQSHKAQCVSLAEQLMALLAPTPPPPPSSGLELIVDPAAINQFGTVTVSFSGVQNPTSADWISLAVPGSAPEDLFDWNYASSCTQTPGTARSSGSCQFTVWVSPGTYEFRFFSNNQLVILDTAMLTVGGSIVTIPSRGQQAGVTQPAGSYAFTPGDTNTTIQSAITAEAAGRTFWFPAGTYPITGVITPKNGNTFVGAYGAILDASGWAQTNTVNDSATRDLAVFRGLNNGVTGVTIRNLTIIDGPEYAINVYLTSAKWIVEFCEISGFRYGVSFGKYMMVRNNIITNNIGPPAYVDHADAALRGGGYSGNSALGASMINNEISFNGREQKFIYGTTNEPSQNLTMIGNYVHDNYIDGLWIDGDGAGSVIENNIVRNNGRNGIAVEIATSVMVRNNILSGHEGGDAILISASRNTTVTGNVLEGDVLGIGLFLDFTRLSESYPFWTIELQDNVIENNEVHISGPGTLKGGTLSFDGTGDQTPYLNNTRNNHFRNNRYFAPNTTGTYFTWGTSPGNQTFAQWQALPQDLGSTITVE